jgi:hypothetical protein
MSNFYFNSTNKQKFRNILFELACKVPTQHEINLAPMKKQKGMKARRTKITNLISRYKETYETMKKENTSMTYVYDDVANAPSEIIEKMIKSQKIHTLMGENDLDVNKYRTKEGKLLKKVAERILKTKAKLEETLEYRIGRLNGRRPDGKNLSWGQKKYWKGQVDETNKELKANGDAFDTIPKDINEMDEFISANLEQFKAVHKEVRALKGAQLPEDLIMEKSEDRFEIRKNSRVECRHIGAHFAHASGKRCQDIQSSNQTFIDRPRGEVDLGIRIGGKKNLKLKNMAHPEWIKEMTNYDVKFMFDVLSGRFDSRCDLAIEKLSKKVVRPFQSMGIKWSNLKGIRNINKFRENLMMVDVKTGEKKDYAWFTKRGNGNWLTISCTYPKYDMVWSKDLKKEILVARKVFFELDLSLATFEGARTDEAKKQYQRNEFLRDQHDSFNTKGSSEMYPSGITVVQVGTPYESVDKVPVSDYSYSMNELEIVDCEREHIEEDGTVTIIKYQKKRMVAKRVDVDRTRETIQNEFEQFLVELVDNQDLIEDGGFNPYCGKNQRRLLEDNKKSFQEIVVKDYMPDTRLERGEHYDQVMVDMYGAGYEFHPENVAQRERTWTEAEFDWNYECQYQKQLDRDFDQARKEAWIKGKRAQADEWYQEMAEEREYNQMLWETQLAKRNDGSTEYINEYEAQGDPTDF